MNWVDWRRLVSVSARNKDKYDSYSGMADNLASATAERGTDVYQLQYSQALPLNLHNEVMSQLQMRDYRVVLVLTDLSDMLAIARAATAESADFGGWNGWAWLCLNAGNRAYMTDIPTDEMLGWVIFTGSSTVAPMFLNKVAASAGRAHPALSISSARPAASASGIVPDQETTGPSATAANLYDAIMLYAHVVGGQLEQLRDGRKMANAMMGISFQGMSGRVDEGGSMRPSVRVLNCINLSSTGRPTMRVVGQFDAVNKSYVSIGEIVWPGESSHVLLPSCPPRCSRLTPDTH